MRIGIWFWLIAVFCTSLSFLKAQSLPTDGGLKLELTFEGEIANRVNEQMDIEARNVTYTSDRHGMKNGAVFFDGEKTELTVPMDIGPGQMPELTALFWVKTDKTREPGTLISHDNGAYDRSLVIVSARKSGYSIEGVMVNLQNDREESVEIRLKQRKSERTDYIRKRLNQSEKTDLYGIFFDTDEEIPKPGSETTLNALLQLLRSDSGFR